MIDFENGSLVRRSVHLSYERWGIAPSLSVSTINLGTFCPSSANKDNFVV